MPTATVSAVRAAKKGDSRDSSVQTILLLAGRSKRFWPLTEKTLWPFLGQPLLAHQMKRLQEGGLKKVTFVGGHHNIEQVHSFFSDVPSIEQEDLDLGMRGALLSALPEMKDGPVCIVSSNDVIEADAYEKLLRVSEIPGVDGAILAQRVKTYFPGGYLVTSPGEEGKDHPRVAGVVEKPAEGMEPSDLVNIVAHVHKNPQKLLEVLEDISSDRDDAYEVALTTLCKELNYVAVPYEGRWDAVKFPWHILDLTERFLSELGEKGSGQGSGSGSGSGSEVHETAVIEGPVVLQEGVKVLPHATVKGPCFIGKGTVIGTGALVRDSIIGEGCVIGFGSEIARSNLHSHVWTHSTYLGDSVVGQNVAFGAGTVAANFRLDEGDISSAINGDKVSTQRTKLGVIVGDDVRSGVHASFAPGVKIGCGSFINSATYVSRDVAEGKYVTVKKGVLEERENESEPPRKRN